MFNKKLLLYDIIKRFLLLEECRRGGRESERDRVAPPCTYTTHKDTPGSPVSPVVGWGARERREGVLCVGVGDERPRAERTRAVSIEGPRRPPWTADLQA